MRVLVFCFPSIDKVHKMFVSLLAVYWHALVLLIFLACMLTSVKYLVYLIYVQGGCEISILEKILRRFVSPKTIPSS